jgi:hypothetical protein
MKSTNHRRQFLKSAITFGAGTILLPMMQCKGNSEAISNSKSFFNVGQRNGRWWLVTPENEYIFICSRLLNRISGNGKENFPILPETHLKNGVTILLVISVSG